MTFASAALFFCGSGASAGSGTPPLRALPVFPYAGNQFFNLIKTIRYKIASRHFPAGGIFFTSDS